MESERLINRLEAFGDVLQSVVAMIDPKDRTWQDPNGGWSIAKIVGHLLCEERNDFRARLKTLLEDPSSAWAPLNPEADVDSGDWSNVDDTVAAFAAERAHSIVWLRTLDPTSLNVTKTHPVFGSMSAGDLLGAWVAHDALHLRQCAKRLHALACRDALPHDTGYAGAWPGSPTKS
jgi:hypothetical protein